ncbi:uncharacterized protein BO88DRAFT_475496 [Aspergillus vadensis CBS 113365]|uniref:Uncharacterized protein n=1 Tax=Aspergillus vadensis (strain CBS 113365 / IMI 142717 / IBT 24658) TaxID=1448311 RepID=A0A319C531_ASPVC|nr:hypothetical protein BO88DRAFT_475496 [Aspergillus vadensis CBS 113365]PYH63892.1 hypothetical protein BO88DRAFT_475496 [Aspergillus vadensis CBS 113365]
MREIKRKYISMRKFPQSTQSTKRKLAPPRSESSSLRCRFRQSARPPGLVTSVIRSTCSSVSVWKALPQFTQRYQLIIKDFSAVSPRKWTSVTINQPARQQAKQAVVAGQ